MTATRPFRTFPLNTAMNDQPNGIDVALHRACVDTLIHDLGGVAGALYLRADLLMINGRPDDARVIRSIATEVRTLSQDTRLIQSIAASGATGNEEYQLTTWWTSVDRFARHFVPRGTRVEAQMNPQPFRQDAAGPLARVTLALLRHIMTTMEPLPDLLSLKAPDGTELVELHIVPRIGDATCRLERMDTPWLAYALEQGRAAGISIDFLPDDAGMVLTVAAAGG